jgi:hypothetical protein
MAIRNVKQSGPLGSQSLLHTMIFLIVSNTPKGFSYQDYKENDKKMQKACKKPKAIPIPVSCIVLLFVYIHVPFSIVTLSII